MGVKGIPWVDLTCVRWGDNPSLDGIDGNKKVKGVFLPLIRRERGN